VSPVSAGWGGGGPDTPHAQDVQAWVAPFDGAAVDQGGGIAAGKYSRSRKIAYGEPNMNGQHQSQNMFRMPDSASSGYSGTTVTVAGHTVSRCRPRTTRLGRRGTSRAKAHAASIGERHLPTRMDRVINARQVDQCSTESGSAEYGCCSLRVGRGSATDSGDSY